MSNLRKSVRYLIHQLYWQVEYIAEEDLEQLRTIIESLYKDLYVLQGIQDAQRTLKPGDSLTREEALQFLRSLP